MNIEEMKMADVEARLAEITTRRAEIDAELQTAEAEALEALEEEVRGLNDEEEELEKRAAAIGVLSHDPRPSYQRKPERIYGLTFAGFDIRFRVTEDILTVVEVNPQPF